MDFQDYDKIEEQYGLASARGDWMRLVQGDNVVRIVSKFENYAVHWDPETKRSVICIGKEHCKYCQEGKELTVKYSGWVIDRADKQVKLLTIGHKIFKAIGLLGKSDEYGFKDIPAYDITINKEGQGLDTRYTVIPGRSDKPLTKKEQQQIDQVAINSPKDIIDNMKTKEEDRQSIVL